MATSTCDLCDAYPDDVEVVEPIFRSYGGKSAFSGLISTIKCHEDNSLVRDAVAEAGAGRVLVVDGGGSLRHSLLGDQLAAQASGNGWSGILIHGAVRDVEVLRTLPLGVWALNVMPLKTAKRGVGERDIPVRFAGVRFHPGMFLYADDNGLLIAARELAG